MIEAKTAKQQYWLNHIAAANKSGLSLVEYAKAHNLKAQNLYQWRCALKSTTTSTTTKTQFTRVVTSLPATSSKLRLNVANATLEFSSLPDAPWLATLLSTVAASE